MGSTALEEEFLVLGYEAIGHVLEELGTVFDGDFRRIPKQMIYATLAYDYSAGAIRSAIARVRSRMRGGSS